MSVANSHSAADGLTSLLFVPGSRPDRFGKALATAASMVCIDLEDAVAPADKAAAREAAIAAIGPRVMIRINPVTTREGLADLLAIADAPALPEMVMVPKVEAAAELGVVRGVLGDGVAMAPLVESVRGLRAALEIAAAPGVATVMFGGADFAGELGVALAWEPLLAARSALLLACVEAGVPAIDVPWIHLDDLDGFAEECARAHALGFQAKSAIHPAQIDGIEAAMRPSPALIEEARAALAAHAAAGGGAIRYNGRMLEAPMVRRYRRIVAMAGD